MTTHRAPSRIVPRAFPGITPGEIEELISNSQVHTYPPGTVLCRENAVEDRFYMLLEGEVEVTKVINDREARLLKTLGPGDFFGEMALIHNAPRAATVVAKTAVIVLELSKEGFHKVLRASSSISLAMVREISNRLRENDEMAIEDLRLRARELAQAYQKLAEEELARRALLSNVAHELRTPLMAAGGYLQLLQKGALGEEKQKETIDIVARNVQQIAALVNDILFLQEMDLVLPEFQPVNMGEVARGVIEQYRLRAEERGVRLRLKDERSLPSVSGDARSLERALMALVDNAIKFSPDGGDVEVRLGQKNGRLIVSVADQGIGIAPEVRPHIFDRFHHLERDENNLYGGIGLGLAITHQVIKQHNGTLEVESVPGKGSTFTITLSAFGAIG